jgi:hypothetical protein
MFLSLEKKLKVQEFPYPSVYRVQLSRVFSSFSAVLWIRHFGTDPDPRIRTSV